jgi:hypothetical protein
MTELGFKKVKDQFGDELMIVFPYGALETPVAIINRFDMKKLKEEMEIKI